MSVLRHMRANGQTVKLTDRRTHYRRDRQKDGRNEANRHIERLRTRVEKIKEFLSRTVACMKWQTLSPRVATILPAERCNIENV